MLEDDKQLKLIKNFFILLYAINETRGKMDYNYEKIFKKDENSQ